VVHAKDRSTEYILDIGMHKGFDAEYYLRKGFRVIGIEPRSDLIRLAERRLRPFIQGGSLEIIQAAVDRQAGQVVDFWIHPTKDDWGSLDKHHAEKGTAEATCIKVPTTSISEIFSHYGTPYLLKSDTEGGEDIVLASLVDQARLPIHLSFEICTPTQLDLLFALPYQRFQIRNQWMNPWITERVPSREGLTNPTTFTHEHSGPFGEDLPVDMWMDSSELRRRIDHWFALSEVDRTLVGNGWLDIHCSLHVT
jgi:FkbM family methyltransferase